MLTLRLLKWGLLTGTAGIMLVVIVAHQHWASVALSTLVAGMVLGALDDNN